MTREAAAGAVVVGGGLHGLAAAWHLARLGARDVVLLERFAIGHDRGSSHGRTRITRSAYDREVYVRLVTAAHREEWPRLEREAGRPLVHRADACVFGTEDGGFERYAAAVAACGADVERLGPAEARRAFPAFRFLDAAGALRDRTAGIVAAADAIAALRGACARAGVRIVEGVRVRSIDPTRDAIPVETDAGTFLADRLVAAAGPWSGELVPEVRRGLTVRRQTVGYFRLEDPAAGLPGAFPPWIYAGADGLLYGVPAFAGDGIKAARHAVAGPADDPEAACVPDPAEVAAVRAFLDAELVPRVAALERAETCLYTCTPTEDFVIDLHPANALIAVGAGFSGHGFKLGPLTGRLLAELALRGRTSVPEFEESRAVFSARRPELAPDAR